jgi:phosphoribosylformylglycinamidine synthase
MKVGIIVFPGSNCDHDAHYAFSKILETDVEMIWHKSHDLKNVDMVFLPGGFSYGDYLRSGSIASLSPVMQDVIEFAESGRPVMGVCNGFQVLTESHLLPGALLRNDNLKFVCKTTTLRVEKNKSIFTKNMNIGSKIEIPIAHGEGNYFADEETIKRLEDNGQVLFRYVDQNGEATKEANPNGSINNIAGIVNEKGNVLGMMPHPERAVATELGSTDGLFILRSLLEHGMEIIS